MRALLSAVLPAAKARTIESLYAGLVMSPVLVMFKQLVLNCTKFLANGELRTFIEKYIYNDWGFLAFLCVLVLVDTVFGVQRNWVQHTISSRAFSRLFTKCSIYLGLLVVTHVMTSFTVRGEPNGFFTWFDSVIYSSMMAREALSILEHMAVIDPRLVPKFLRQRLAVIADEGIAGALNSLPSATPAEAAEPVTGCAGKPDPSPTEGAIQ